MCMYIQVCVGMCRYVPGDMCYIFHHFLYLVSLDGSVVHSANSAQECSWRRVFELQNCQSHFAVICMSFAELIPPLWDSSTARASLFMHSWEDKSNTYTYLHLHAQTCLYMHIHAHTFKYLQILTYIACMCMYVSICRYCMYVKVLPVCVGMSLCVCIACMCRYCRHVQVCHYV